MLTNIKAVIFDLDGTLIDSMWVWKDIDIEYLASLGYECPPDLKKEIEGLSFTETAQYFKKRFDIAEDIETIRNTWIKMAQHHYRNNVELKNGVQEFLDYIDQKGIIVGMATSNDRELLDIILTKYEIGSYFKAIVTSCDVKKGKPHPDVFLKACELLQVQPEECLVFEDTVAGAAGAKAAGMRVVGIYDEFSLPYHDEIKEIVDHFIDDFYNVIKK